MKRAAMLVTVLVTALALAVPAGAGPIGEVFQASSERVPYVVILADDPVVAYEGDLPGLSATKPGRGQKVNPNSPAVRRYVEHLDGQRAGASARAGIDSSHIVSTYDFALVGFSALLTPAEAERLTNQKGVVSVQPRRASPASHGHLGRLPGPDRPGRGLRNRLHGRGRCRRCHRHRYLARTPLVCRRWLLLESGPLDPMRVR